MKENILCKMKLLRSIVTYVVCERLMGAREDVVHDFEGRRDRNEAHGKLKLEGRILILMIV